MLNIGPSLTYHDKVIQIIVPFYGQNPDYQSCLMDSENYGHDLRLKMDQDFSIFYTDNFSQNH